MDSIHTFGSWEVSCAPEDGGRLTRLGVGGRDLLTPPPAAFRPPARDYGRYETRPVYGYDDCFPTVDPCLFPGLDWEVPDHGELCWLPWTVRMEQAGLRAETRSQALPVRFTRILSFGGPTLRWSFAVENGGDVPLPFLHVMHALMPIDGVAAVELPVCQEVIDEPTGRPACAPGEAASWLRARPEGTATMLLLRRVADGQVTLYRSHGDRLEIRFPRELMPTLGVWWNLGGYPDEAGIRRRECAFEPLAGSWSSLARSAAVGETQTAPPKARVEWFVEWTWKGEGPCR